MKPETEIILFPKLANPETEISKPINISAPNADLFVMNTA